MSDFIGSFYKYIENETLFRPLTREINEINTNHPVLTKKLNTNSTYSTNSCDTFITCWNNRIIEWFEFDYEFAFNNVLYKLNANPNVSIELIQKFPNQRWDYRAFFKLNKSIPINTLLSFLPSELLPMFELSKSEIMNIETIYQYPTLAWDFSLLSYNLPLIEILKHETKRNINENEKEQYEIDLLKNIHFSMSKVCSRKDFTENYLIEYYQKCQLDFTELSRNETISASFIRNTFLEYPWDVEVLHENTSFEVNDLKMLLLEHVSYESIEQFHKNVFTLESLRQQSLHLHFTTRFYDSLIVYDENIIKSYNELLVLCRKKFNCRHFWEQISNSPYLYQDFVLENKDKPFHMTLLSRNTNITFHFINQHKNEFRWDFKELSVREDLPIWFFEKYYIEMDSKLYSKNMALSIAFIVENATKYPWNLSRMFQNDSLEFTDVPIILKTFEKTVTKNDFRWIFTNTMKQAKSTFYFQEAKRNFDISELLMVVLHPNNFHKMKDDWKLFDDECFLSN